METANIPKKNLLDILERYDCGVISPNQPIGCYDYSKEDADGDSLCAKLLMLGCSPTKVKKGNEILIFVVSIYKKDFLNSFIELGGWYNQRSVKYIPKGTNLVLEIITSKLPSMEDVEVGHFSILNDIDLKIGDFKLDLSNLDISNILNEIKDFKLDLPQKIIDVFGDIQIITSNSYIGGNVYSKGNLNRIARKDGWRKIV
jgi:hypothetical protein